MCQGVHGVDNYVIVFHALVTKGGLNKGSLLIAFQYGSNDTVSNDLPPKLITTPSLLSPLALPVILDR